MMETKPITIPRMVDRAVEAVIDKDLIEVLMRVSFHLQSTQKTAMWLKTSNPMLGDLTPLEMFLIGRGSWVNELTRDWVRKNQLE